MGNSTLSKSTLFLFELNFKMFIFLRIFCTICILFGCCFIVFSHINLLYGFMICTC